MRQLVCEFTDLLRFTFSVKASIVGGKQIAHLLGPFLFLVPVKKSKTAYVRLLKIYGQKRFASLPVGHRSVGRRDSGRRRVGFAPFGWRSAGSTMIVTTMTCFLLATTRWARHKWRWRRGGGRRWRWRGTRGSLSFAAAPFAPSGTSWSRFVVGFSALVLMDFLGPFCCLLHANGLLRGS